MQQVKVHRWEDFLITRYCSGQWVSLRVNPGVNPDKVSNKAGYRAGENCVIANDDTLTEYVHFKVLVCHWKIFKKSTSTNKDKLYVES